MGMGHAVYRTYDPTSPVVLKELSRNLAEKTNEPWFEDEQKKLKLQLYAEMKSQKEQGHLSKCRFVQCFNLLYVKNSNVDLNTPIFRNF